VFKHPPKYLGFCMVIYLFNFNVNFVISMFIFKKSILSIPNFHKKICTFIRKILFLNNWFSKYRPKLYFCIRSCQKTSINFFLFSFLNDLTHQHFFLYTSTHKNRFWILFKIIFKLKLARLKKISNNWTIF
jgi:hypothetical protein